MVWAQRKAGVNPLIERVWRVPACMPTLDGHSFLSQWLEKDCGSMSQLSMHPSVGCRKGGSRKSSSGTGWLLPALGCAYEPFRFWELWKASKFVPSGLIYFVEVKLELMALMVYSAPKWFLALRQARPALLGGFPSVDHIVLRVCFVLKLLLGGQICASEVKR